MAIEVELERIAALVEYDINDYLPPRLNVSASALGRINNSTSSQLGHQAYL